MFIDFREKMNECTSKMSDISLLRGQTIEVDKEAKNRNEFFKLFDSFCIIVNSIRILNKFNDYHIPQDYLNLLKEVWNLISDNYINEKAQKISSIKNMISKLDSSLESNWKAYITARDSEILDMLDIFSQVCNNKREISEITSSIRNMNSWPIDEAVYQKYENRRLLGEKKINEIHFDAEIEDFLRKVKNQKASLLDLKPEILNWIKENNFDKNIMLSIKITQ